MDKLISLDQFPQKSSPPPNCRDFKDISSGRPRFLSNGELQSLTKHRIIQRNLVYVINLAPAYANARLLQKEELFGQYGKIMKCLINKNKPHTKPGVGFTYSAHIMYASEIEAAMCIKATNNFVLDDKILQVTYGTTKYCNNFLLKGKCQKPKCAYLHQYEQDSMDKEYVIKQKHIEPVDSVLNRIQIEVRSPKQNYILPNVIRSRQAKSYSVDSEISHSRFDFANQTTDCEEGDSSPELLHPPSPLETKVRIQARELKRIFDCAPWIKDICAVYSRNEEIDQRRLSIGVEDEDTLIVAPKTSNQSYAKSYRLSLQINMEQKLFYHSPRLGSLDTSPSSSSRGTPVLRARHSLPAAPCSFFTYTPCLKRSSLLTKSSELQIKKQSFSTPRIIKAKHDVVQQHALEKYSKIPIRKFYTSLGNRKVARNLLLDSYPRLV